MQEKLTPEQIAEDPAASLWIKDALKTALERDPVDAANDAEVLAAVLKDRCDEIQRDYNPRTILMQMAADRLVDEYPNSGLAKAAKICADASAIILAPPKFIEYPNGNQLCPRCVSRVDEYGFCRCPEDESV